MTNKLANSHRSNHVVGHRLSYQFIATLFAVAMSFGVVLPSQAQTISCLGRTVTQLDFSSSALVSGTALQVGAVYRFSNVATGFDALVTILGTVNGASLNSFDTNTGLIDYFQPEIITTGNGAVDFRFDFVVSGGSTPAYLNFAATSIDIDGNGSNIREYVEFETTQDATA